MATRRITEQPSIGQSSAGQSSTQGDLAARHRSVLPSWLALYYDEPIEIVRGRGRRVIDADASVPCRSVTV